MTTITMTTTTAQTRVPAQVTTAVRFVGHLLSALVGVAFLGRDLEH